MQSLIKLINPDQFLGYSELTVHSGWRKPCNDMSLVLSA